MSQVHALLVEGVPGIGKSTTIDGMLRRHVQSADERKIRTLLHLSQTWTYGPLAPAEDAGTLTAAENRRLLDRIVQTLEWLREDVSRSGPSCFVLIDTLHLTHCVRPGVLPWSDAVAFDRRLATLGCRLLLLRGRAETIRERSARGRSGTQFREYATKFGRNDESLASYFSAEQTRFDEMFDESTMIKTVLENDGPASGVADEAYRFWQE